MMSLTDFVHKHKIKIKGTWLTKKYRVFFSIGLDKVVICPRNRPFSSDVRIIKVQPTKWTHWVVFKNGKFFHSNGCSPRKRIY